MSEFDPTKLAAHKQENGIVDFNQGSLDSYKNATKPKMSPQPITMYDKAKLAMQNAGTGLKEGFAGTPPAPGAPVMTRAGNAVGQEAGPILGMTAMGLAAGAAVTPPGMAVVAGLAALGAAGGRGYQDVARASMGKETPDTTRGAAVQLASEGAKAALTELGVGMTVKGAKLLGSMLPDTAFSLLKIPVESFKRAVQRPWILAGGPEMKAAVETKAIDALRAIQEAISAHRASAGDAVEAALTKLHTETGGAKIFNLNPAVTRIREYMGNTLQSADPTVREIAKRDLGKIERILKTMEDTEEVIPKKFVPRSKMTDPTVALGGPGPDPDLLGHGLDDVTVVNDFPGATRMGQAPTPGFAGGYMVGGKTGNMQYTSMRSARVINQIKRSIQNLSDYSAGGVPKMETDIGQDVLKQLGRELRLTIEKGASDIGHAGLKEANDGAKAVYDMYDEVRPIISTVRTDRHTLLEKVKQLAADFHAGGLPKEMIEDLEKQFPKSLPHVHALLDSIAARSFLENAAFTPSGGMVIVPLIRALASPKNVGKAIEMSQKPVLGQAVKTMGRASAMLAAPTPDLSRVLGSKSQEQK